MFFPRIASIALAAVSFGAVSFAAPIAVPSTSLVQVQAVFTTLKISTDPIFAQIGTYLIRDWCEPN
jgi:hypothetical protein